MIFAIDKNKMSYAALTFDPRTQITTSGVYKYDECMPVSQQRAIV